MRRASGGAVALAGALSLAAACASRPAIGRGPSASADAPDSLAIAALARALSADSNRGRGPWTPENERVARYLARVVERLGARPLVGSSVLVPFTAAPRPADTVFNVIGVLPARGGATMGEFVGLTAHLDHLGVAHPGNTECHAVGADSICNGFLDDAIGIAIIMDVARRYARAPGDRPLAFLFFNLEEQGLLGAKAFVARPDASGLMARFGLLIGVDAGSPAGEALEWQLMSSVPPHAAARLADSLARGRGWTTTASAPRPISDVFPFAERGVPILFPIPGRTWRGYTDAQRTEAMQRFDHYHQPSDEWRADFPLIGTATFADWLWSVVRRASDARTALR